MTVSLIERYGIHSLEIDVEDMTPAQAHLYIEIIKNELHYKPANVAKHWIATQDKITIERIKNNDY